jgi:hypothetical protein
MMRQSSESYNRVREGCPTSFSMWRLSARLSDTSSWYMACYS